MKGILFVVYSLLIYVVGVLFSSKTALLLKRYLRKPLEFLRLWEDLLYVFLAISFLGYLSYLYWPLENDDSQILIFLVTLLTLAFTALIGDKAHKYRTRPVPEIEFHFGIPDCHQTKENNSDRSQTPTYYLRMRVKNIGKTTLRDVAVTLESIKKNGVLWDRSIPLGLQWTGTEAHLKDNKNNIPRGSKRTIDLLKVREDERKLRVCCIFPPNTLTHILDAGNFELFLSVDAENSPPLFAKLTAFYDNGWAADEGVMFGRNLVVKLEKQGIDRNVIFDDIP